MIFNFILFLNIAMAGELPIANASFSNGAKLKLEVARTFNERYKGLMGRTTLQKDHGMLFVFDRPQKLSFWMKNTYIDLSIAYLDKDLVIQEIYQMKRQNMMERTQDLISYPSQCECQYALEVNPSWFKDHKVSKGSKLTYSFVSK